MTGPRTQRVKSPPARFKTVDRYRPDETRNFIRVDDHVKVAIPGKHPFVARVSRIDVGDSGEVLQVTVCVVAKPNGRAHPQAGQSRTFLPERIERVDQTKWKRT